MSTTITAILATVLPTAPALAGTPGSDCRISATESRDAAQESRITAGAAKGRLNTTEAARLNSQQARIDQGQTRLAADGHFSRRDDARIDYRLDKANRNIVGARNNRR